jgi:mannose-6-phosphate isomerase-like protein (cupin superfamily)
MTEPFWFLGGQARILLPGAASGGSVSVLEFQDPIGHATPLHVHGNEDEVWIVLDGEVSFFVGDQRHDLESGQATFGPRGVPHAYLVRSPTAKLVATFAPAGIEEWFAKNGSPVLSADEAPAPFDLGAIVAAAEAFKLTVAGPPPSA